MKRASILLIVLAPWLNAGANVWGGFGGVGAGVNCWDPKDIQDIIKGRSDPDGLPNYGLELPSYGYGYLRLKNFIIGAHATTCGAYQDTNNMLQAGQLYQRAGFLDFGLITSTRWGQMEHMFLAIGVGGVGFGSLTVPKDLPDTLVIPKLVSGNAFAASVTLGIDFAWALEARDLSHTFIGIGLRPSLIWTPTLAEIPGLHKYQVGLHVVTSFGGVGHEPGYYGSSGHKTGYTGFGPER